MGEGDEKKTFFLITYYSTEEEDKEESKKYNKTEIYSKYNDFLKFVPHTRTEPRAAIHPFFL